MIKKILFTTIKKKQKHIQYFCLSLILILGLVFRLYKINSPVADWHSWRQVDTASVSLNYYQNGINLLFPKYHDVSSIQTGYNNPEGLRFVEFPIFNLLHVFLYRMYDGFSFETTGRIVSIVSALITTVGMYFVGRKLIGPWGGVIAAGFYSMNPYNVFFTRVILPEPLAVCFAVLSFLFFIYFIEKENTLSLFSSAVFFSLAMLVKPFSIFYILPYFYLAVKKYGLIGVFQNKKLLLAIDVALIPFFLWRYWMNNFVRGIPHFTWAFNGDKIRFKPSFWMWLFGERVSHLILGYWGLIPFGFGLVHRSVNNALRMLLLGMFLYVSVIATANVRHDYYQTFLIPAIGLVFAQGIVIMCGSKEANKFVGVSLAIFSFIMMELLGVYQIREFYKINDPSIVLAGTEADRVLPKDAMVIAPYNGSTAFLYQTKRWGWPVVDTSIDEMIERGADYYISVNTGDIDSVNFKNKFKTVVEKKEYLILDLHSRTED
ncbi:hypothetical protein A2382_00855 [Candidatus Woesebacteria bacterium RIFOXYB1_FULL_38_16]|uniref:Glycosyltransferase RgtA/B/C/D-like domain-containing protein n=1 Tax=Candidatus Woesebacteria bacterium RIFOXYB1_FULL_38_16 TaxID=1802538 RepID=A0A1F8CTB4_9BACT|nr:MAG: hypothetical protein A2191_00575 [Candidatus Woesebacteria bacterium RIFOXYA1_FULL_38_9]OGM79316.1 MAG: hypothetical protein A2382_00855 [Candidatus Woesebacteria bacterium RIFOXYB1_FULL_38_16]